MRDMPIYIMILKLSNTVGTVNQAAVNLLKISEKITSLRCLQSVPPPPGIKNLPLHSHLQKPPYFPDHVLLHNFFHALYQVAITVGHFLSIKLILFHV